MTFTCKVNKTCPPGARRTTRASALASEVIFPYRSAGSPLADWTEPSA